MTATPFDPVHLRLGSWDSRRWPPRLRACLLR